MILRKNLPGRGGEREMVPVNEKRKAPSVGKSPSSSRTLDLMGGGRVTPPHCPVGQKWKRFQKKFLSLLLRMAIFRPPGPATECLRISPIQP